MVAVTWRAKLASPLDSAFNSESVPSPVCETASALSERRVVITSSMLKAPGEKFSRSVGMLLAGAALVVGGFLLWRMLLPHAPPELRKALERRGRLLVAGTSASKTGLPSVPGTALVDAQAAGALPKVLRGNSPQQFVRAMTETRLDGVLLPLPVTPEFPVGSLGATLASYGVVDGLVGTYLSTNLALYSLDRTSTLPPRYSDVLAKVARRLLAGESPPRLRSFPPLLRRVQHVEVMVLLSAGPRPRLWRSARGSSIARAFLTATRVARRRWQEREQAMGESLEDALPHLAVEVALLTDDGEIGTRDQGFIDRVVTKQHGIAYEHKGGWRYLLPEATREQGAGSATRALSRLLEDNGLAADSYKDPLVRVSRLRVQVLAKSEPPAAGRTPDPLAVPQDPGELLAP